MISVLLTTVREFGYREHPDWDAVGKVIDDLAQQTYNEFELVVVDGLYPARRADVARWATPVPFEIVHVPPRLTLWTRHRKVAISTYRNTGLAYCRGELVVNLDDCCVLPKTYLAVFAKAWKEHGLCAAMTWPRRGDSRAVGRVTQPGLVYGFGSYPLAAVEQLNGYDEAYDGSQGLEDVDWSTRLWHAGVEQVLVAIDGFDILPQTGHDPRAVDDKEPLARCCNQSWQTQRVWRQVKQANRAGLWRDPEAIERLVGPCRYAMLADKQAPAIIICKHHQQRCPYVDQGFVLTRTGLHEELIANPPVWDYAQAKAEAQR